MILQNRNCALFLIAIACLLCPLSSAGAQTTVASAAPVPDGKPHKFELRDKQFKIDGQPLFLAAGEMHFARVLPEDWETRIKQAKAMGLNTISFYIFWNQVEPKEGKFDFSGTNDLRRVLKLCQENGLWAILRPGPYCCAEVEYGGIPYWTLKYPDVKIRTNDPKFIGWCRDYINEVYKRVADLQVSRGGPLLMVQIDNEYGIVANGNNDYMKALHKVFLDAGFEVPLFICDPSFSTVWRDPAMRLPGVLNGRNGLKDDAGAKVTAEANGDMPIYSPEIYTAWFSGWGAKIEKRQPIPLQLAWLNFLFEHHYSFCLFPFFGGTNYGFYNGCNEFLPVQTSYDYDAPIDEAGRITAKFKVLRDLYSKQLNITPPAPPSDPAVIEIPSIKLDEQQALIDWMPQKPTLTSVKPVSMEDLDQAYGLVLYRKKFDGPVKGTLELRQAMDYTIVMANGKTIAEAFRGYGLDSNKIQIDEPGPVTLDLLIYNLGRISVPVSSLTQGRARKGLIDGAYLDGTELNDWQIYSLPMENVDQIKPSTAPHIGPTLYHGTFNMTDLASTFLDMRNWGFGAVWVNGHNLGRYWDRGGLRSLFLSSHFLKQGKNDIVILELHDAPKSAEVSGGTKIIEEPAVPFAVRLDKSDKP
ncbi:MAG: beta-galactosidase [Planctomycetota bacterium]|nr:beta-galactosidase [Planctomycetota bacterium]